MEKGDKQGDTAKQAQENKKAEEEGGSAAGVVIGVIGAIAVVGGLVYCWKTKKCCFKGNKDFEEGGEKQEFKRNAKVSLVDN